MLIDFSTKITDLTGEEIKEGDKAMTLSTLACGALTAQFHDEANLPADAKVKRFRLALAAVDGGEREVSVEDVAELKKLIGRAYGPLFVGRAFEILDPPKAETGKSKRAA